MADKQSTTIDTVSTGVNLIEKLAKITKEYGFFGILKSIFLFVICGYCVFFTLNPTYMFDKYDKYKDQQHNEQIMKTFQSTSEINDMLKNYMYSTPEVDRIFYIEFHNSIKGLDKLPYVYGSFRHEFTKTGQISYLSDEFKDDFMISKYQIFDYLYQNGSFCGGIDDLKKIDERSAVMLGYCNIEHFEMILIESDGIPVGVLGVTLTRHINNEADLLRLGYTLLAKKTR